MKHGIITTSIVAVRDEPSEKSEMLTQVQFGELFEIVDTRKNWYLIKTDFDNYTGWIDVKAGKILDEDDYYVLSMQEPVITTKLITEIYSEDKNYPIRLLPGSEIRNLEDNSFVMGNEKFIIKEKLPKQLTMKHELIKLSLLYLNSPYLWGGKSPFGIDCSGLTQILYKTIGINLPRDAREQVKHGITLNFINETKPGDLAFFDNEEGEIIHVGLIIEKGKIIHASGQVKINTLDHQGIYNEEEKKYTHKLRVIQRIV
ncbi:MAG: C40 family peptidase [Marinilabiliales bacterium]